MSTCARSMREARRHRVPGATPAACARSAKSRSAGAAHAEPHARCKTIEASPHPLEPPSPARADRQAGRRGRRMQRRACEGVLERPSAPQRRGAADQPLRESRSPPAGARRCRGGVLQASTPPDLAAHTCGRGPRTSPGQHQAPLESLSSVHSSALAAVAVDRGCSQRAGAPAIARPGLAGDPYRPGPSASPAACRVAPRWWFDRWWRAA
jgi:hypothetical protein